ncbi:MAG: disulfide bond formation protein B [Rhodospirillaceae bacterium]
MTSRPLTSTHVMGLIATAALMALTTAWVAQYGFGLFPCELCLYQRLPYIGIVALAGLSALPVVDPEARRLAAHIAALLFATTAGVAVFHVGVEQEWWAAACAPTDAAAFSFEDIRSALQKPGQPACNDIPFTLFGISFAGYNVVAGLFLAGLALKAARTDNYWKSES